MEAAPAPNPEGAFQDEVGAQMTADPRAALVRRRLSPASSGLAEAMIQDALAGIPRERAGAPREREDIPASERQ